MRKNLYSTESFEAETRSELILKYVDYYFDMDLCEAPEAIYITVTVDDVVLQYTKPQLLEFNMELRESYYTAHQDATNYKDLVRELSSPEATGRI